MVTFAFTSIRVEPSDAANALRSSLIFNVRPSRMINNMTTRRAFVKSLSSLTAVTFLAGARGALAVTNHQEKWFMPDESDPHLRTWMAFGASQKIWGKLLT